MIKELLEALRAKFAGVNDSILNRVAEKLAKTVTTEDQVKAAVEAYTLQQLLDSNGDFRATEATQSAVKNYEKKYNLKEGKIIEVNGGGNDVKPTKPDEDKNSGADTPDWAKALLEQNKALTERLNKLDADKTSSDRKTRLNTIISKLPESLRKAYEHTSLEGTDEEFGKMLSAIETDVTGMCDTIKAKGVVFKAPGTSNVGGDKEELTEAQLKAIQTRSNSSNTEAQPF